MSIHWLTWHLTWLSTKDLDPRAAPRRHDALASWYVMPLTMSHVLVGLAW